MSYALTCNELVVPSDPTEEKKTFYSYFMNIAGQSSPGPDPDQFDPAKKLLKYIISRFIER